MNIDIWSDIVCPWCYIGKRRFESALARFDHRDDVTVVWHSFELDPTAGSTPGGEDGSYVQRLAAKFDGSVPRAEQALASMTETAAAEGLDYHFEIARPGNTFDAHRLLHLAAARGVQDELKERLLHATLSAGRPIADHLTLTEIGVEAGLDHDEVVSVLADGSYAAEVRADQAQARAYGITGVPFFVVDAKYGVSGAQPAEALLEVMTQAWHDQHPLTVMAGGGDASCEGDNCVV